MASLAVGFGIAKFRVYESRFEPVSRCCGRDTDHHFSHFSAYGLGAGVGRGLGVGVDLPVHVAVGVGLGVAVAVAVAVGVGVGPD